MARYLTAAKGPEAKQMFADLIDARMTGDYDGAERLQRRLRNLGINIFFYTALTPSGPASVSLKHCDVRACEDDGSPLTLIGSAELARRVWDERKRDHIQDMAASGSLPHFRYGARLLFDESVCRAVLHKRAVERARPGVFGGPGIIFNATEGNGETTQG